MFLYHYTSKLAYDQILSDQVILKSDNDRQGTKYCFGPGVYLTSLSPDNSIIKLKKNNRDGVYKNKKYANKEESYFKFRLEDLESDVEKIEGRDVWLYSKDIDLTEISYYHNEDATTGKAGEIYIEYKGDEEEENEQDLEDEEDEEIQQYPENNDFFTNYYYSFEEERRWRAHREQFYPSPSVSSRNDAQGRSTPSSSQHDQEQDESGTFGTTAGITIAAVAIGIGAAVFGLLSSGNRRNNNH